MDHIRITGYIKRLRDAQRYRESQLSRDTAAEDGPNNSASSETSESTTTKHDKSPPAADPTLVPMSQKEGISNTDLEFLLNLGVPMSEVFDCRGGTVGQYKTVMEELGKTIAINATPCYAHGHRIRTRANHCVQCNTRNYAFLKQYLSGGWVYIASSQSQPLLKIGITNDPEGRDDRLNYTGYGGITDWKIRYCLNIRERAGELECQVHKALRNHRVYRSYHFCGVDVACQEIFSCDYEEAKNVLENEAQSFDVIDGKRCVSNAVCPESAKNDKQIMGYIEQLRDAQKRDHASQISGHCEIKVSHDGGDSSGANDTVVLKDERPFPAIEPNRSTKCRLLGITNSDYEYFHQHGMRLSEAFNCHGGSVRQYKKIMKALGKTIAVNATPCKARGHTIRTRSNHCIQCNTRNLGFLKQHLSGGWVYIAASHSEDILKIGLTKSPDERECQLNYTGYGGISDWVLQYCLLIGERAGQLECRAHRSLRRYQVFRSYDYYGVDVACYELFNCRYVDARDAIDSEAQYFDIVDKREGNGV